jgi:hypothetical protein
MHMAKLIVLVKNNILLVLCSLSVCCGKKETIGVLICDNLKIELSGNSAKTFKIYKIENEAWVFEGNFGVLLGDYPSDASYEVDTKRKIIFLHHRGKPNVRRVEILDTGSGKFEFRQW